MAYEDVPQRLLDGEDVPQSEIIGYAAPMPRVQVMLILHRLESIFAIERDVVDGRMIWRITPTGQTFRQDYVKRIEGDCPECPECP